MLIQPVVLVLINAASGTLAAPEERTRLHELLQAADLDAEVVEVAGGPEIDSALDRHSDDIVVAAGGDGTVSAVASRLAGTSRTLGVIPGGTLNHFAKDLNIPQDLAAAVALLRDGHTRNVDIAEVNGRKFINNSSLGLYPEVVREREKIRRRGFRKWTAFAAAIVGAMARWPLLRVRLDCEGRAVRRLTPFVFIGNNRYRIEGLQMGSRDRLDCGEICICSARPMSRTGLVRMMLLGLTGGLRDSGDLDVTCARELWVDTRPRGVDVALDGEIVRLRAPLHYVVRPGALRVIAP